MLAVLARPFFFLVVVFVLGAASSRSLFARRFSVLRPCVCWCALCFRLSGLKMFACPSARVFLPGGGLSHVLVCEVVGVSAGRRFFALCLRGGSTP